MHTNEQGVTVEQAVLRRMAALGFRNRGIKRSAGLAVLKYVFQRGVSHALIETCFIDDKDDMALYGQKFDAIARAIADGVAEGFGVAVQSKEEDEMVKEKTVSIDGKDYACSVIEKDGENYMRLRDLTQAGYGVTYDASTKTPGMTAPQTRADIPAAGDEVQAAIDKVRQAAGLEEQTMTYLLKYQYGDELVKKIAAAVG
nr:N-acetylmuramoyl-L-alanine amidase [uncultured Agathobaculum sp.]